MCFGSPAPYVPPPEPPDEPPPPEYMITKKQTTDTKLNDTLPDVGLKQLQISRMPNELQAGSGLAIRK
jgi:ABC-type oligopeptide transport system ATPase subunit